jgi:hypothetical protein
MSVKAITKTAPRRSSQVFGHGERDHVPDAAPVEVSGTRMMKGVARAPVIVRRKRRNSNQAADIVVSAPARKERAMRTVVLNHEQTNEEARRGKISSAYNGKRSISIAQTIEYTIDANPITVTASSRAPRMPFAFL